MPDAIKNENNFLYYSSKNKFFSKKQKVLIELIYGFPFGVMQYSMAFSSILFHKDILSAFVLSTFISMFAWAAARFLPGRLFWPIGLLFGGTLVPLALAGAVAVLGRWDVAIYLFLSAFGITSAVELPMLLWLIGSWRRRINPKYAIAERMFDITFPFETAPKQTHQETETNEPPIVDTQYVAPFDQALILSLSSANGQGNDPIVIPTLSNEVANLTVLKTLRSWEEKYGNSICFLDWEAKEGAEFGIYRVRFQRRRFTETEITTDRVAFYFDLSAIEEAISPSKSPTIWSNGGGISFPHDLGWLHFDKHVRNSQDGELLDVSLFYSCPEGTATIYVYGSCAVDASQAIIEEAEEAFSLALTMRQEVKAPWPFQHYGPQYGRFLLVDNQIGFLGVSAKCGKFIKVRLTFNDECKQHREMLANCMDAISKTIEEIEAIEASTSTD